LDAHVHLFPDKLFRAIWRWFDEAGWIIPYAGWNLSAFLQELAAMGVDRSFVLPYAHKPDISLELNRWIDRLCRKHPRLIPFAAVHPEDERLWEVLETALDEWGFAGVKLHLAVQGYRADHPALRPVFEAVHRREKAVLIHAGTAPYVPGRPEFPHLGLDALARVLQELPRLKVVIPHFGLDELEKALRLVDRFENVFLDTSWVLGNPKLSIPIARLEEIMAARPQRVIYGSDFPILEHAPESGIRIIQGLSLDEETKRSILHRNAERLIGWA
jgi:hypothetical protein